MATKVELEEEVEKLRQDLAEARAHAGTTLRAAGDAARNQIPELEEVEAMLADVAAEVKKLPERNPLLLAAGALLLGYMLGRSR